MAALEIVFHDVGLAEMDVDGFRSIVVVMIEAS
jgi:hypothetical protein